MMVLEERIRDVWRRILRAKEARAFGGLVALHGKVLEG